MIRILRTALHRLARKPLRGIMTLLSFSLSAAILAVLACLVFQINDYIETNILGSGTRVWISTFTGRNAGEAKTLFTPEHRTAHGPQEPGGAGARVADL